MNLNQVTISSVNLNKAIEFYELLGLTLIVRSDDDYARFVCPGSNHSTFSIQRAEVVDPLNGTIIYFECDNLDQKVEALEDKGITFLERPTDKTWLWRESYLQDPDGNMICLYYAGENRLNPPWKIK